MAEQNGVLYHPNGAAFVRLDETERRQYDDQVSFLTERLDELEQALSATAELTLATDDLGWQRQDGSSAFEFSRAYLRRVTRQCRVAFLRNPLINRAVTLQSFYVWGQGISINAHHPDVDAVVQAFLDDVKNQAELTSHQARTLKEQDLQVDGNVFFAFFVDPRTGRVRVRTVPVDQVEAVVTNPDDAKDAWFYRRIWTDRNLDGSLGERREAYYPDWRHMPATRQATIGQVPINWATPVYHVKVGGLSEMRFGVPEVYAAVDWAKAYKAFLEDWATITRAYSRFAWNLTTKGGAKGVQAAKAKLGTTLGTGAGAFETNPPPVAGSTFIGAEGVKLDPIRTAGATVSAEDGRRLLLMVAAATGLPETFFGDADVGNHATSKTLDRPTELKFADRRTLWADVLVDVLQFVVARAVMAPEGLLAGRGTASYDADGQLTIAMDDDPETGEPIDTGIDVTWPPILEHDVSTQVDAVVKATTLGGQGTAAGTIEPRVVSQLLLGALGVDDLDEILDRMYPGPDDGLGPPEEDAPPAGVVPPGLAGPTGLPPVAAGDGSGAPSTGRPPTSQEAFTEALRELRAVLVAMKEGA